MIACPGPTALSGQRRHGLRAGERLFLSLADRSPHSRRLEVRVAVDERMLDGSNDVGDAVGSGLQQSRGGFSFFMIFDETCITNQSHRFASDFFFLPFLFCFYFFLLFFCQKGPFFLFGEGSGLGMYILPIAHKAGEGRRGEGREPRPLVAVVVFHYRKVEGESRVRVTYIAGVGRGRSVMGGFSHRSLR